MDGKGTVLVTGGSGYIGGWCAIALLQQGYVVRTTVRDLAREAEVRGRIGKATDPGNRLSFHAADLMADAGWDAAAEGCDYVLHVASPLGVAEPKDENELIVPAREGAKRALKAAIKAGAKRVVLTSSVAAAGEGGNTDSLNDETCWTDVAARGVSAYQKSKTIAERAAWDMIEAEGNGKTSLATVNPTLVLGPVLGGDYSESVQVVERLLSGRVPGVPRLGFNIDDVRDMLRAKLPAAQAAKVPTRKVPNVVVRLVGLFDKDLGSVAPRLGRKRDFTSAKAQNLLGWRPRPTEETVLDCARSLIAEGLV
jgi:nucleoside-diphosphate-sugar epimerase